MTLIRHVGVVITDVDKSLNFYRDALGFKIYKTAHESGDFLDSFLGMEGIKVNTIKMFDKNNNMLELLYFNSHPETNDVNKIKRLTEIGCSHFALTVDKLDFLYDQLTKQGIEFIHPPQMSPDGKVKAAFCRDPDGTFIEMVEEL